MSVLIASVFEASDHDRRDAYLPQFKWCALRRESPFSNTITWLPDYMACLLLPDLHSNNLFSMSVLSKTLSSMRTRTTALGVPSYCLLNE